MAFLRGTFFGSMALEIAVFISICGWIIVTYKLSGDGICNISRGLTLLTKVKPPKSAGAILSACSDPLANASPLIANWVSCVLFKGLPNSALIP